MTVPGPSDAVGGSVLVVVGASGDVATRLDQVLSTRGTWAAVQWVDEPSGTAFEGVDVVAFVGTRQQCLAWAPVAVAQGAVAVDATGALIGHPDVPLVAAGVNPAQVRQRPRGIVAVPSGATLACVDAFATLHGGWGLTQLVIATYQAASDVGPAGSQRLRDELAVVAADPYPLGGAPGDVRRSIESALPDAGPFPAPLAMNVVPWVGAAGGGGWTSAETELRAQLRALLGAPGLRVSVTCVRVPVVAGCSMAVHAVLERPVPVEQARQALVEAPTVVVLDDPAFGELPTPSDVVGSEPTFVGRMRQSVDDDRALELFLCRDDLRALALATVRVAELVAADLAVRTG